MAQRNTATVGSAVPAEHVPLVSVWQHVGPEQYPAEWFQALVKRELPGGVLFLSREVRDDRRHVMVVTEGQLCLPGGSCLQWVRYCDPSSVDDCLAQSILRVTRDCASFVEVSSFAACFSATRCNACVILFFSSFGGVHCDCQLANVVMHDNFAAEPVQANGSGLTDVAAQQFLTAFAAVLPPGSPSPDSLAGLATWLDCNCFNQVVRDVSEAIPAANRIAPQP